MLSSQFAQVTLADEKQPAAAVDSAPEPAPRESLELLTKDRVLLNANYFAGARGKQTIPVILLHGWEGPRGPGSSRDMEDLALLLQQAGHAVVVPDLRGHGKSLRQQGQGNEVIELDRERFGRVDFRDMTLDVEAIRSFFVEEHNAGKLNLELLCVIGADMGSVVALNWIHYDWMAPSVPALKQGQDVKAFALLSPTHAFRGVAIKPALANQTIRRDLAALITYGESAKDASGAKRIHNTFKRAHARRKEASGPRLQHLPLDTRLSGTKILASPELKLADAIVAFVDESVRPLREAHPWKTRARQ